MPLPDGDISWQVLRRIVQDWAGTAAELAEVTPLDGGCISTTLKLQTTDGQPAVLKISQHRVDRSYEEEAYQLNYLRDLGVPTPRIFAQKTGTLDDPFSYILLEFIPGMDLAAAKRTCDPACFEKVQQELGEIIAALHGQTATTYGKLMSGETDHFSDWPSYFRHLFDPVWSEAEKCGLLSIKQRKTCGKVHEKLDRLLAHDDQPRLVHWDIWSSNILAAPNDSGCWGIAAILDPGCKYAHAEAELAYVDLFRTGSHSFFKAYQHTHRLPDAYHHVRKPIYQLYFLLNHLQLFGREYVQQTSAAIERVGYLV